MIKLVIVEHAGAMFACEPSWEQLVCLGPITPAMAQTLFKGLWQKKLFNVMVGGLINVYPWMDKLLLELLREGY